MTPQQLTQWNDKFMKGWEARNPAKVMSLFDKRNLTYFESSLQSPVTSWDQVNELWQVVPTNQKEVKLWSEILACNDQYGIIHWKLERLLIPANKKQNVDGIFVVTLNKDGLCTYFNQWRTVAS